jgi:hypothetical protein
MLDITLRISVKHPGWGFDHESSEHPSASLQIELHVFTVKHKFAYFLPY